jgi:hypothetical protein
MPAVLRSSPYRFFFYAGDRNEPPHVHVERESSRSFQRWLDERVKNPKSEIPNPE